jgi:hypothetical protein
MLNGLVFKITCAKGETSDRGPAAGKNSQTAYDGANRGATARMNRGRPGARHHASPGTCARPKRRVIATGRKAIAEAARKRLAEFRKKREQTPAVAKKKAPRH